MLWPKFITTLFLSWYPFMCVHELGHILSAKLNNGDIQEIKLIPWQFSQTIIAESSNPLMDAWSGTIIGSLLPFLIWLVTKKNNSINFYTGSFAGFCLLANGLYMGLGWIDKVGDSGDIIRLNGSILTMVIFSILSSTSAFILWHHVIEPQKT